MRSIDFADRCGGRASEMRGRDSETRGVTGDVRVTPGRKVRIKSVDIKQSSRLAEQ